MSAKLIGIGVGPGDPELLTLKAVRRLEAADVVVAVAAAGKPSRSREIAAPHLPAHTRTLEVALQMGQAPGRGASYARLAAAVAAELDRGATVAVLCEGDPLLFGTFIHLLDALERTPIVEVVPGIPSPIAAAARECRPLAVADEGFAILPATMGPARLHAALATVDSAAIIKVGRHLAAVRDLLDRLDLLDDARLVVELGGPMERRLPLAAWEEEGAPYFSLVLTRGLGAPDGD